MMINVPKKAVEYIINFFINWKKSVCKDQTTIHILPQCTEITSPNVIFLYSFKSCQKNQAGDSAEHYILILIRSTTSRPTANLKEVSTHELNKRRTRTQSQNSQKQATEIIVQINVAKKRGQVSNGSQWKSIKQQRTKSEELSKHGN